MRNIFLFLSITFAISLGRAQAKRLQTFETDYCTLFAEGTAKQPDLWKHCCFEHDLRYWFGGDLGSRDIADKYLKQCVKDAAGTFWSRVIYDGVRAGHISPVQHRLHWGWGWTPKRGKIFR